MQKTDSLTLKIEDDFDLQKITACGQCFRARTFEDGTYRFITGEHVLYIRKTADSDYLICCDKKSWKNVWTDYFDFGKDYKKLRAKAAKYLCPQNNHTTPGTCSDDMNHFLIQALTVGTGIRILRQDAWEMLITFIISQRKNIPAISKAVETLSIKYGNQIVTDRETVYTFPAPETLCTVSEDELHSCGLGYRAAYVMDAAQRVASGSINLTTLAGYDDEALFNELLKIHGVGKKIANCVCLFGYGRTSRVPVDVWITRAISEECHGLNPFDAFGNIAGIIQQYVFYYKRSLISPSY